MRHVLLVSLLSSIVLFPAASPLLAHCDTLDGPVVLSARQALEKGDVTPVLKWVKNSDEAEIRSVFDRALAARKQGDASKALADRYFFETVVRVHRQGEGAPYTGLKPAGEVEAGVAAADTALAKGSADELTSHVAKAVTDGIRDRLARTIELRKHADESVEAGRRYVAAYVDYIHYVERLAQVVHAPAHAH